MKFSLALAAAPLAALATPLGATTPAHSHQLHHRNPFPAKLAPRQAPDSIDELIKQRNRLYFGAAGDNGIMQRGKTEAIQLANFGQVTPEYSMKWDATEPAPGNFTWGNADYLVDWAQRNDKIVHGHTLLWHTALPTWVSSIKSKGALTKAIQRHVKEVVKRYKGKIRSWDVVNEIFNDDGTLRNNSFFNVLGEEYVGTAFRAARDADPDAKLYLNDYNLDNKDWAKLPAVVKKVDEWIDQGIPIDGIGSQSHLAANMSSNVEAALRALAASKVSEILITELDIDTAPPAEYAAVVNACLRVRKCRGITVWGVSDSQSWKSEKKPLLFDADYNPKPAYNAIVNTLKSVLEQNGKARQWNKPSFPWQ
ncbi:Endo-1,4-beta-xylanase [Colletotrichum tanaceti]|uniref:Beta-xylanase n=1 Tax=Colletotrichum tanaceti TaxID=1306861 RepID=A0A4U6X4X2_9PEZI|nr:Endo-1,4-beta-xylanase [Colletotrichum tanaceti]TKW50235.1 Endo-1,4-beta-xylanase [Colletotrichum tanaceti]